MIFDGKKLAREKEAELAHRVAELKAKTGRTPKLAVVMVGDDPASGLYVGLKQKAAARVGIGFELKHFPQTAGFGEVADTLRRYNEDDAVTGLMIQLPVPEALETRKRELLDEITPRKDVDCLTSANLRLLKKGIPRFVPATVKAVTAIIEEFHRRELSSKPWGSKPSNPWSCVGSNLRVLGRVLVVGASGMVGEPLVWHLRNLGGEVETADEYIRNLAGLTREADVIISATGVPGLITGEMVKEGVAAIDVGSPKGDFDFASVAPKARLITPVPGGVGPLTVAALLENVVENYDKEL